MDVTSVRRVRQEDWTDEGVRFLRARDLVAFAKNEAIEDPLFISDEMYREYSAQSGKVVVGDLLVTGVGTIGVPWLVTSENPVYFKDGNIIWFKNQNAIDGGFFYHSFTAHAIQSYIKEAAGIFGAASFHVVTCNPPYMIGQHGLTNPHMPKAIARHEILCTLEDVVSQAAKLLGDRGRFYMVHRPFRLTEIMNVLTKYKLEPKRMQLVYPYIDREPNMVLIEALKGGNSRITVERPLIVYEKPGVYTKEILEMYDMV